MTPRLIIDGYNLMHAAGLALRSYGPGELEACRQRLLQLLSDRLPLTQRRRTRVVFDARIRLSRALHRGVSSTC